MMSVINSIRCPQCRHYAWHFATMTPQQDSQGNWHHPSCPTIRYGFGANPISVPLQFTMGHLLKKGVIIYGITRLLGASPGGALIMGLGDMLFIAGSGYIPPGWKRYVLGLF